MDAHVFLTKFRRALPRDSDALSGELVKLYPGCELSANITAGQWTAFITRVLHTVARRADLGCCCRSGEHPASPEGDTLRTGARVEYLFDFTWFNHWTRYALPVVIIEHENEPDVTKFMNDFWKLMFGYAPLRVMIGYACRQNWQQYLATISEQAQLAQWQYPTNVEDLVLIGKYDAIEPRGYRVIYRRPRTRTFRDIGWLDEAIAYLRQETVS